MATATMPSHPVQVGRTGETFELRTDSGRRHVDFPAEIEAIEPEEITRSDRPLPEQLIDRYVMLAVRLADCEELEDRSGWFASVRGFDGVYGEGETESAAVDDLHSSMRGWVVLKMARRHGDIPLVAGIDLNRG